MKTKKTFFYNQHARRTETDIDYVVVKVSTGRYGRYGKRNGVNYSEKRLLNEGYIIAELTDEQITEIKNELKDRKAKAEAKYKERKLKERAEQIDICLNSKPVEIIENEYFGKTNTIVTHVANLSGTEMIKAYHGCGKGTAYIKYNKVIAFHYGYEQPENIPDCDKTIKIDLSATQICFSNYNC